MLYACTCCCYVYRFCFLCGLGVFTSQKSLEYHKPTTDFPWEISSMKSVLWHWKCSLRIGTLMDRITSSLSLMETFCFHVLAQRTNDGRSLCVIMRGRPIMFYEIWDIMNCAPCNTLSVWLHVRRSHSHCVIVIVIVV